ncbi:unnamed protein product [Protopolystoma xenopodis]|uniref:Mediator of RNA polymerase II transcription subunit 19 n=1 Tax=Protopolystoma xenopodis TaxID=117903 RepID=A0A448WED7_9PLAT|nr:unnamed protein product [Protopolystoma xenopodis]
MQAPSAAGSVSSNNVSSHPGNSSNLWINKLKIVGSGQNWAVAPCEPFYLMSSENLTTDNPLTGAKNLIEHYGLESAYQKFCGKKLRDNLSAFLPHLPGNVDVPASEDGSSLMGLIERPPIRGKELRLFAPSQLDHGFRLHPGPLPQEYAVLFAGPPAVVPPSHPTSGGSGGNSAAACATTVSSSIPVSSGGRDSFGIGRLPSHPAHAPTTATIVGPHAHGHLLQNQHHHHHHQPHVVGPSGPASSSPSPANVGQPQRRRRHDVHRGLVQMPSIPPGTTAGPAAGAATSSGITSAGGSTLSATASSVAVAGSTSGAGGLASAGQHDLPPGLLPVTNLPAGGGIGGVSSHGGVMMMMNGASTGSLGLQQAQTTSSSQAPPPPPPVLTSLAQPGGGSGPPCLGPGASSKTSINIPRVPSFSGTGSGLGAGISAPLPPQLHSLALTPNTAGLTGGSLGITNLAATSGNMGSSGLIAPILSSSLAAEDEKRRKKRKDKKKRREKD